MKKLIVILFPISAFCQCPKYDTTVIKQEVFPSINGQFGLLTANGSIYDNVIHGSLEFVESQKEAEFQKALRRRKAVAIITVKCSP